MCGLHHHTVQSLDWGRTGVHCLQVHRLYSLYRSLSHYSLTTLLTIINIFSIITILTISLHHGQAGLVVLCPAKEPGLETRGPL